MNYLPEKRIVKKYFWRLRNKNILTIISRRFQYLDLKAKIKIDFLTNTHHETGHSSVLNEALSVNKWDQVTIS
jgi:hypothetical protein